MNLLFITGEFPPQISGIGDQTFFLAQKLHDRGFKTSVSTGPSNDNPSFPFVTVQRRSELWGKPAAEEVEAFIEKEKPHVIHIQFHTCSFARKMGIQFFPKHLKKKFPTIKIVTTYHEFAAPMKRFSLIPMFLSSDANLVTNDRDYERISNRIPFQSFKKKLFYIPMGSGIPKIAFSPEERQALRKKMGLHPEEILLLRFGFLHEAAFEEILPLFDAVHILKSRFPVKIMLLGSLSPSLQPRLQQAIEDRKLASQVLIEDSLPAIEVSKKIQIADIGLAPYTDGLSERRTGFITLLAHGLPIITTRKGHFPACLQEGRHVLSIAANRNPELWAEKIEKLILNQHLRQTIAQAANDVAFHYDWNQIAAETSQVYQQLCESSSLQIQ